MGNSHSEALTPAVSCKWGNFGGEEVYVIWKKLWGLNLPPKFALFSWKVIHRILPVREVLVRRGMAEDVLCPVCGLGRESLEHLFFECDAARRVCRASS